MRIYLDLCCLKRPFDDGSVVRNRLEAEAVLSIQKAIENGLHEFVRSPTHDVENAQNPNVVRRERVGRWLRRHPLPAVAGLELGVRAEELARVGFGAFDARHLAWAEALGADCFVTTDDAMHRVARRVGSELKLRVVGPLELVQEVVL